MKHSLIIGNALEVLQDQDLFPDSTIDLAVTSPPYGLGKDYGVTFKDNLEISQWGEMIEQVGTEIYRTLKPNGSFFLNVSPIPQKKTKEIIPLDSYAFFALKKCGFHLRNKIIWHFNS